MRNCMDKILYLRHQYCKSTKIEENEGLIFRIFIFKASNNFSQLHRDIKIEFVFLSSIYKNPEL
jgi:hypothetical protein